MLDVIDLCVSFDGEPLLEHLGLHVDEGEIVALLGPSGVGKSTLLRVIAGILRPEAGRVLLDGVDLTDVPTHRRGIGFVFQDEQLFPQRDVAGNVAFGLEMAGVPRAERRARVQDLLELVGLGELADRRVGELSGGEAKRVALVRSLAPRPRLLLLDEPLTGLDRPLHDRLAVEAAELLRRQGTTAVWVTHDEDEAATVADRIVRLTAP